MGREYICVSLSTKDSYDVLKQVMAQVEESFMMVMTDDILVNGQPHDLRFVPHLDNKETAHSVRLRADGTWTLDTMVLA